MHLFETYTFPNIKTLIIGRKNATKYPCQCDLISFLTFINKHMPNVKTVKIYHDYFNKFATRPNMLMKNKIKNLYIYTNRVDIIEKECKNLSFYLNNDARVHILLTSI